MYLKIHGYFNVRQMIVCLLFFFLSRPMRSSKTKAMDQVKQWCGTMKDEDNDGTWTR